MSAIRMPQTIWKRVYEHLFGTFGEHFAFLLAAWTWSRGSPVFMVKDVILIDDQEVEWDESGGGPSMSAVLRVVNAAARSGYAVVEIHNHGGKMPRFSPTDRRGFREFVPYILGSLPGRPYAATVWGDSTVYGEYFTNDDRPRPIGSIHVVGDRLEQLVSRDDDGHPPDQRFARQLPWFTDEGQRRLGRIRVGVVGAGGTGSETVKNLAYLGIRDFVIIDRDRADKTSLNRLITARAGDVGKLKSNLAAELIKGVAPGTSVLELDCPLGSHEALDALKGVDVIFGCVDNDGARLVLNELAVAYGTPYFDMAVGIYTRADPIVPGGRVAVVLSGGPCLSCMGEIDVDEARFYLASPQEQAQAVRRGYVEGMDVAAPAVLPLNAQVAAMAVNEFSVYVSGIRPVSCFIEFDLLGVGHPVKSQWTVPTIYRRRDSCTVCAEAGKGDRVGVDRFAEMAPKEVPTRK